jgi:hypothetical protein
MTTPAGNGTAGATGDQGASDSGTDPNATDPAAQVTGGASAGETGTGEGSQASTADDVAKWKALARKHEARAKENATAAEKLRQLEDRDKTELQRATERAQKAEAERAAERAERFRLMAASRTGLGAEFAVYLSGTEQAEIDERADALAGAIDKAVADRLKGELAKYGIQVDANGGAPTAAGAASLSLGRRPVESLRPGSVPTGQNNPATPNDMFRGMLGGR